MRTLLLFSLLPFFVFGHDLFEFNHRHKAFRTLKNPKINKKLINIQRLKFNETSATCPMFQSFATCACEPTCNNPEPRCPTCTPGCTCRNGFVRNSLHLCVLPEECPPTKLRRFELQPPKRLYAAVPVTTLATTSTTEVPEQVTVPLMVFHNGPTPPPAPPMLESVNSEMGGAPAATPPPDFSYGPPGMNSAKIALYEDFLKQKRIMRALRRRRNQFAKRML